MKTTKSGIIDMVKQLNQVIEVRKANEKIEKELKAVLKEYMGEDATLEAGPYMVLVESRSRNDLDKNALIEAFGLEIITKYSKTSTYDILTIKSLKREV